MPPLPGCRQDGVAVLAPVVVDDDVVAAVADPDDAGTQESDLPLPLPPDSSMISGCSCEWCGGGGWCGDCDLLSLSLSLL